MSQGCWNAFRGHSRTLINHPTQNRRARPCVALIKACAITHSQRYKAMFKGSRDHPGRKGAASKKQFTRILPLVGKNRIA